MQKIKKKKKLWQKALIALTSAVLAVAIVLLCANVVSIFKYHVFNKEKNDIQQKIDE